MMTVGSLFAGIGGLDLGLERAGMRVKWQVEIDEYCNKVLEKHWPNVERYGDIKTINWSEVAPVDVICGGFPCQPVSCAGKQKGDSDERWLWPEFLRAIREVRPNYAVVENVPGLLSVDDGRLARRVFGDLAEVGYDAEWGIVSAADVGAPHLRQRVFILAHAEGIGLESDRQDGNACDTFGVRLSDRGSPSNTMANAGCVAGSERAEVEGELSRFIGEWDSRGEPIGPSEMADTNQIRLSGKSTSGERGDISKSPCTEAGERGQIVADPNPGGLSEAWPELQTTGIARDNPSRRNEWWAVEPRLGRVADGVPDRVDRLKCLGNAVVPQVAEVVGRWIVAHDSSSPNFKSQKGDTP